MKRFAGNKLAEGLACKRIGLTVPVSDVLAVGGLTLLGGLLMFWKLGLGSLFNWDESIYAEVAREMIAMRDWNTLHLGTQFFFEKPPLYVWLTALAYKVFGVGEFAARFWSAVSGLGMVLFTYVLGSRMFNRWTGLTGAVMLLGISNLRYSHGYNFVSLARVGQMDAALAAVVTAAFLLAWLGLGGAPDARPRAWIWVGVPVGLGMLIKNVVALLPLGALFLSVSVHHGVAGLRKKELWLGTGLAFAIALPWHLGQWLLHGQDFLDMYVGKHILGRSVTVLDTSYHYGSPLFFLDIIRKGFPIWAWLMLPAAVYALYRAIRRRDKASFLLLVWAVVPLAVFSTAETKIGWYAVIFYPALVLMTAAMIFAVARTRALLLIPGFMVVFVLTFLPYPRLPSPREGSPGFKAVASAVPYFAQSSEPVYTWYRDFDVVPPSDLFYTRRPLESIVGGNDVLLRSLGQTRSQTVYLLSDLQTWSADLGGEVLHRSGDHVLVRFSRDSAE